MAKTLTKLLEQKPAFINATDPISGSVAAHLEDVVVAEDGTIVSHVTGSDNKPSASLWGLLKLLIMILQKEIDDDGSLKKVQQSVNQDASPVFSDVVVGEALSLLTHLLSQENPHAVSAEQVGLGNVEDVPQIPLSERGQPNGIATLDANGNVEQLPVLDTDTVTEAGNLYYTEARVQANTHVALNTANRHTPHTNRVKLDTIDQDLSVVSSPQFAGVTLPEGGITELLGDLKEGYQAADTAIQLQIAQQEAAGAGRSFYVMTQPGHSLVAGDAVAIENGLVVKTQATEALYRESAGIVESVDEDNIYVVFTGYIKIDSASWTPGEVYVLSDTVLGGLQVTDVAQGNVQKPILLAISATEGLVLPYRGVISADPFDALQGHTHDGIDAPKISITHVAGLEVLKKNLSDFVLMVDPENTFSGILLRAGSILVMSGGEVITIEENVSLNFFDQGINGREAGTTLADFVVLQDFAPIWAIYNPTSETFGLLATLSGAPTFPAGYTSTKLLGWGYILNSTYGNCILYLKDEYWQAGNYRMAGRSYGGKLLEGYSWKRAHGESLLIQEFPTLFKNLWILDSGLEDSHICGFVKVSDTLAHVVIERRAGDGTVYFKVWDIHPDTKNVITTRAELATTTFGAWTCQGVCVSPTDGTVVQFMMSPVGTTEHGSVWDVSLTTNDRIATARCYEDLTYNVNPSGIVARSATEYATIIHKTDGYVYHVVFNPQTLGILSENRIKDSLDVEVNLAFPASGWQCYSYSENDAHTMGCCLWYNQDNGNVSFWMVNLTELQQTGAVLPWAPDGFIPRTIRFTSGTTYEVGWGHETTHETIFLNYSSDSEELLDGCSQLSEFPGPGTFKLPDTRGRALIGEGQGEGLTARNIGDVIGSEEIILSKEQMPSHNHEMAGWTASVASGSVLTLGASDGNSGRYTHYTGDDEPHDNMPPSIGAYIELYTGKEHETNL